MSNSNTMFSVLRWLILGHRWKFSTEKVWQTHPEAWSSFFSCLFWEFQPFAPLHYLLTYSEMPGRVHVIWLQRSDPVKKELVRITQQLHHTRYICLFIVLPDYKGCRFRCMRQRRGRTGRTKMVTDQTVRTAELPSVLQHVSALTFSSRRGLQPIFCD